ncbi:lytic transglycosylase domain-containing protein [Sphingobium sp. KCTC 72723]|uniref:lytic transglycosylase domain-containing protein n=1 Tax=Sphingobium sp. KCTC 72723 TaxID=2733867 RepID=UPI0039779FE5
MGLAMITRADFAPRFAPIFIRAVLAALMFAFPVHSLEARTTRQNTIDEQIVATCIARSAAGRGWLAKTLWGLRDQEGGWIGAEVANSDGSHDLGPLQVNSWWVPRLATITGRPERHVRHWLKQDACFNVEAARWIFLSGLATTRDYWKAIGVYHSPTGWRQQRYTSSVLVHLRRRFGASLFARPSKGLSPVSVTTP